MYFLTLTMLTQYIVLLKLTILFYFSKVINNLLKVFPWLAVAFTLAMKHTRHKIFFSIFYAPMTLFSKNQATPLSHIHAASTLPCLHLYLKLTNYRYQAQIVYLHQSHVSSIIHSSVSLEFNKVKKGKIKYGVEEHFILCMYIYLYMFLYTYQKKIYRFIRWHV